MTFHLSAALDRAALNRAFLNLGFVQIRGALPAEHAQRVYQALVKQTPWNLVFNQGDKHIDVAETQIRQMAAQDAARLQSAIHAHARENFQYLYNNYPIYDAAKAGVNEGHVLHRLYEWLNTDEFLSFAREVTGFEDISFADAQATRFLSGHFLCDHDDSQEGKNRRAAYILNLTPRWRPDWGGYLQLLTNTGDIRHGLMPAFNTLNIIAVPQRHSVSMVAPFAAEMRLAITGWLRAGSPD